MDINKAFEKWDTLPSLSIRDKFTKEYRRHAFIVGYKQGGSDLIINLHDILEVAFNNTEALEMLSKLIDTKFEKLKK